MSLRNDDSVFSSLQQVTGTRYNRSVHNRDLIDTYLLRKAREKGIRLPTGGPPDEYKYLGAWVETSTAGMSHNVVYIDVGSMYPSYLITLNASPETLIGTEEDLRESQYTEDDCVWGYIDPRPVKHLSKGEPWNQYTNGEYKMVYDPHAPDKKWSCDDRNGPQYTKLYFKSHDVEKGFLTECVEELIDLKDQYRGTSLYGSTKRVTNCFTDDTDILTPYGSKNITEVDEGDIIYTFETDSHILRETTVDEVMQYPHYEDMVYRFHNDDIDIEVTPEHDMVYINEQGQTVKTEAGALARELTSRDVTIPSSQYSQENVTGTVLTAENVDRYKSSNGVYCLNVGGDNTVLAGRNGKFTPVGQSIYGVLGFANEDSSFRLFDWRIAEAITLCGRKMIKHSRDYVLDYLHERGYEDAYSALGDTDGVGISVPSASTRHEALEIVEQAVEQLNGPGYDQFFQSEFGVSPENHAGEIEVESYAPKVFIPSRNPPHGEIGVKKRRIEWQTWDEDDGEIDEIDITGLEATRSDVAPITKEAQREFAETLRMEDSEAREYLFPKLREMADSIEDGSVELDRVCKRGGIGQDLSEYGSASRRASPHYRGAKYANANVEGVTIQRGGKPRLVYVEDVRGQYPSTYDTDTAEDGDPVDAVTVPTPARLPDEFVVDYSKHLRKALLEPTEALLQTRGWSWSEIRHQHEQTGLELF